MVIIKKGDFVKLEYTGRTKTDNHLFDTTDEKIAKKEKHHNSKVKYGPITACVGWPDAVHCSHHWTRLPDAHAFGTPASPGSTSTTSHGIRSHHIGVTIRNWYHYITLLKNLGDPTYA